MVEEWRIINIGSIADTSSGGTPSRDKPKYFDGNIPWVKTGELANKYIYATSENITEEAIKNSSAKLFPVGAVLIAMYGATIGRSSILKIEASSNQACCAIFPNDKHSSEYMYYSLAFNKNGLISRGVGGAQPNISQGIIKSFKIPIPPLPEQNKIADILSTVDEAIQNTKAQIEKTKELKRGLMQKLFSEGIGHTEFKDSKLGRIPKEWEVVKYDKVVKKLFVGIATSTTEYYDNEDTGTLLIRNTNIKNGYLDLSSVEHITKAFDDDNTKKRLRTGDVLSVRTGYPGISAVVPVELDGSQSFTTLVSRFDQSIVNPYFVCYQLNSELGRSQIKNLQFGGQQQNLNVGSLRLLDLIVPPKEEQDRIVEILKVVDNKKDNLDQELKLQIDKKKGLMQKLLTGEVRVKI